MFNTFIEICKLLGIFLQDYFYRLIRKLKRENGLWNPTPKDYLLVKIINSVIIQNWILIQILLQ